MIRWIAGVLVTLAVACDLAPAPGRGPAVADPLPSWNAGPSKQAIQDFVGRVTREGGPDFVPPAERVAVFDNDGTLWPEAPVPFQAAVDIDELRRRSSSEPQVAADPMVKAALSGDIAKLLAGPHHDGLLQVLALTHTGMTTTEFDARVASWLEAARHPRWNRPYD